jgi:hypothetical protein
MVMRIKQYKYGNEKIQLTVEVDIFDQKNDEYIYLRTYKDIQSDYTPLELKGNKKELQVVFDEIIKRLQKDNCKLIEKETFPASLECIADVEQYGNYLTLKIKIKS